MPINQIQVPQQQSRAQEKEESVLDKILKGVQIANALTGVYGNVETGKKASLENDVLQRQSKGIYTAPEAAKANLSFTPGKTSLLPEQQGGSNLLPLDNTTPGVSGPPMKAPKDYEGVLKKYPGAMMGAGGEPVEGFFTSEEEKKQLIDQAKTLAGNVKQNEAIQVAEKQAGNYRNLVSALNEKNPSADAAAVIQAARMYNPGITRAADGSVVGADSLPETLSKHISKALGGTDFVLKPEERKAIEKIGKQFLLNAADNAQSASQEYAAQAVKLGVNPKSVGVGNYYDLLNEIDNKGAGQESTKEVDAAVKELTGDEKYELYLKNLEKKNGSRK